MTGRCRRRIAVSLLVVASALVGGCRPGHASRAGVSGSARPPAGASPSDSFDPLRPPTVPAQVHFVDLGTQSITGEDGIDIVSPKYMVRPNGVHTRTTIVTRRSDGHEVLRYTPARKDYEPGFVGLSGDMLVIADEDTVNSEPGKGPATATIFNLATGVVTPIGKVPGAPPLSLYSPQATVTDGKYFYASSARGQVDNCVGEVDLVKLTGRIVICAKKGESIQYVHTAQHGASWIYFHGYSFSDCRDGQAITDGRIGPVGPADDCGVFDTTVMDGWQFWATLHGSPAPSATFRATNGAVTVELGQERPGLLATCGHYIYWDPETDAKRIVRWRPGEPIQLVYQATGDIENTWTYGYKCADGTLTLKIDRYDMANGQFSRQLMALEG